MTDEIRIVGRVRANGNDRVAELNEYNELIVTGGFPRYTEMTRRGTGYSVIATAAVAGLVVRPDTVAGITLYNGEAAGGPSYIVDRIFTHCLVAGGEAGTGSLWACIHPAGMTAPTADIAPSATNWTGPTGKTYNGLGIVDVGATVVDNGWYPWGTVTLPPTALPGAVISVEVGGRLIVPPTGAISLQVVTSVNDETYTSGLSWYEEEQDLVS